MNKNKISIILWTSLLSFLLSLSLISADTDGVFTKAENIRGGIVGQDEQEVTSFYKFINPLIADNITTPSLILSNLEANCTLSINSEGKVGCANEEELKLEGEIGSFVKIGAGNLLVDSDFSDKNGNLIYDKNKNENSIFQLNSGLITSHYSAVDFLDKGLTKWGLGKDDKNDFFIDEFGVANRFIIQKITGNIGIGIPNPSEKLEVNGKIKATSIDIKNKITTNDLEVTNILNISNGIQLSHLEKGCTLKINNDGQIDCLEFEEGLSVSGEIGSIVKIGTDNSLISSNLSEKNGNVGIGISNPTAKLEVNGNIKGDSINVDKICSQDGTNCENTLNFQTKLPTCPVGTSLISDGTNWLCYISTCSEAGGIENGKTCLFDKAGNYNFQVPNGTSNLKVSVVGGGGGSGSQDHSHWNRYGGGGGGGAIKTYSVSSGESFSLTVGEGGTGIAGWGLYVGNSGTASKFNNNLIGNGGEGGRSKGYNQQTPGGTGSGGDENCKGGVGKNANYFGATGGDAECFGGEGQSGTGGSGAGATPIGGDGGSRKCGAGAGNFYEDSAKGADGCILIEWS